MASAVAEDLQIKATLKFLIWRPPVEHGVLIEGDSSLLKKTVRDQLLLQHESGLTPVSCSSLRQSAEIDYAGGGKVRLLRAEADSYLDIARFSLRQSGEYTILLTPTAVGYESLVIPVSEAKLPMGTVLMVNTTRSRLQLCESGARPLVVNSGKSEVMTLLDPSVSTLHLTAHRWEVSSWKPVFQKPFSLRKRARSVFLLYSDTRSPAVRFHLFSGL